MKYKCITGGPISENCYLLIDEKTNQAAVVDPGFLNDVLLNEIKKYTVQRILLTHGHFDHIWEADRLHEMLGVPVCAYETEAAFAADDKQNGSLLMMYESITCKVHEAFKDGETFQIGEVPVTVLHTPGHRPGCLCFYAEEQGVLFSGDTLFCGAYGRLDLPEAQPERMRGSLERLFALPPETIVYPGHGEATTIGQEVEGWGW